MRGVVSENKKSLEKLIADTTAKSNELEDINKYSMELKHAMQILQDDIIDRVEECENLKKLIENIQKTSPMM